MNERFGGVVANSTKTLPGIISNIKDNATIIASGVFEPLYNKINFDDFCKKWELNSLLKVKCEF